MLGMGGGREIQVNCVTRQEERDFPTIPLHHIVEVKGTNQYRKQTLR